MIKRPGGSHYEEISWPEAFSLIGSHLRELDSPDEALFYTSGRASNEAAFLYQLFARAYGTNNLPDCSNMCHESTGVALTESIGIGKGSVSLRDIYDAKVIVLAGQNPGTNHPRMLSALETAKRRGARIIAINPLREAGLVNFRNPQRPAGIIGRGTDLADVFLPIASTATSQGSRPSAGCSSSGTRSTTHSSAPTPTASTLGPSTSAPSTGRSSRPPPA